MNKILSIRDIVRSSVALMVIAGIVTAALAGTNALTQSTIAARQAAAENAARKQVIAADSFEEKTLNMDGTAVTYHEAVKDGAVTGYVFVTVGKGKSAGLTVMTGIRADGIIAGVVITDDNETAGYVDKVTKGGLLRAFRDKAAALFTPGKNVDTVSQATKTSKGIIDAVNQAIARYQVITAQKG